MEMICLLLKNGNGINKIKIYYNAYYYLGDSMHFFEILLISISLSMDAFIVSLSKSMYMKSCLKNSFIISFSFGLFQAIMPLIGYFIGYRFESIVVSVDHFIAFICLTIIGLSMILDNNDIDNSEIIDFKTIILLSIATSIDAFIVGITLAFLNVNIFLSISTIGLITFIICFIGTLLGKKIGSKIGSKSKIFGGVLLIFSGIRILFEHLLN